MRWAILHQLLALLIVLEVPLVFGGTTFTTKTVSVPAATGAVSDVNVSVNVTHERMSDLEIQIVSPKELWLVCLIDPAQV